jgi:hypothetical protein
MAIPDSGYNYDRTNQVANSETFYFVSDCCLILNALGLISMSIRLKHRPSVKCPIAGDGVEIKRQSLKVYYGAVEAAITRSDGSAATCGRVLANLF